MPECSNRLQSAMLACEWLRSAFQTCYIFNDLDTIVRLAKAEALNVLNGTSKPLACLK